MCLRANFLEIICEILLAILCAILRAILREILREILRTTSSAEEAVLRACGFFHARRSAPTSSARGAGGSRAESRSANPSTITSEAWSPLQFVAGGGRSRGQYCVSVPE